MPDSGWFDIVSERRQMGGPTRLGPARCGNFTFATVREKRKFHKNSKIVYHHIIKEKAMLTFPPILTEGRSNADHNSFF